ncbi:MAG: hypothetical protein R3C18_17300 [Planctomycetaceae bacterium]
MNWLGMWKSLGASLLAMVVVVGSCQQANAIGFPLSESKEELKLKYEVEVTDHGTDRVTVVFTLEDEGRMKPLDEVQFYIPAQEKNANGGYYADLVVSIEMREMEDGKRRGRVHILRELAERGEIWLNTHHMDGEVTPLTRWHHIIPVAKHLPEPKKQS